MTRPAPVNHQPRCQGATTPGCSCGCLGMLHQSTVLRESVRSPSKLSVSDMHQTLEDLFGSSFATTGADPLPHQKCRRKRKWTPSARGPSTKQLRSQTEQRVVDTTLNDVLARTFSLPAASKTGWLDLVDALTLHPPRPWNILADQIRSAVGAQGAGGATGYFWASMLAATAIAMPPGASAPSSAAIIAASTGDPVLTKVQAPRARSGNRLKEIPEMLNSAAVTLAADEISAALSSSQIPDSDKRLMLLVVGVSVSADLWLHPSAVRHLLVPAVSELRARSGQKFSLDGAGVSVEQIVDDVLADCWRMAFAW